jgi:hypothetical protein
MISSSYTVTTTAQIVVPADESNRSVYFHVTGNGTVYLGGADVTSANGCATQKNAVPQELFVPANETVYAIVASGTEDLRILRPSN